MSESTTKETSMARLGEYEIVEGADSPAEAASKSKFKIGTLALVERVTVQSTGNLSEKKYVVIPVFRLAPVAITIDELQGLIHRFQEQDRSDGG